MGVAFSVPPDLGIRNEGLLIVVMGVSGTGKSTLGSALAKALGMPYVDGDDLHPRSNVDKMASGQPLTDGDREPWLERIRTTAEHVSQEQRENGRSGVVVACSALKKYYRDILRGKRKPSLEALQAESHERVEPLHSEVPLPTYFVFIKGGREVLIERMEKRTGHFMKAVMLDSQLSTLESPEEEDGVVVVSLDETTEEQVAKAVEGLSRLRGVPWE